MSYSTAARTYYHGDKTHLKQPGHDLIGRGVADLVEAALRGVARGAWQAPGANLSHHRHAQASPQTEELCFLWYRSGLVDKRLDLVSTPSDAGPALSCTTAPRKAPTHGKASGRPCRPSLAQHEPTAPQQSLAPEEWRLGDFSRGARLRNEVRHHVNTWPC